MDNTWAGLDMNKEELHFRHSDDLIYSLEGLCYSLCPVVKADVTDANVVFMEFRNQQQQPAGPLETRIM